MIAALPLQPRPFRALVQAFVLQDLRSQHFARAVGAKPGEALPPVFWVIGQYMIASGVLSAALFMRVDVWSFAFANLSCSVLLVAAAVVVEFGEIVVSPDDVPVVGHRPVTRVTYASARLVNLALFVTLVIAAVTIVPAILGAFLRDSALAFTPAYAVAAAVSCTFAAAGVTLAYAVAASRPGQTELRDVLAWTQIVLILVLGYGAQWMFRDSQHSLLRFFAHPPGWLQLVPLAPPADFVVHVVRDGASLWALRWLTVALTLVALVTGWLVMRLAVLYAGVGGAATGRSRLSAVVSSRPLVSGWHRLLAGLRQQAALLALCFAMLRRDGDLRMRTLPVLGSVLAVFVLGLAGGQLGNPFADGKDAALVSLVVVQLVAVAVPAMMHSLTTSRDHEAAWLLQTAPWRSKRGPAEAIRKTVCYGIALPLLLVLGVAFSWLWRAPLAAAAHTFFGWVLVLAVGHATLRALDFPLPLATPPARGDVTGAVAPWTAVVALVAVGLGAAQAAAVPRPPLVYAYALGLLLVWCLSWAINRERPAVE